MSTAIQNQIDRMKADLGTINPPSPQPTDLLAEPTDSASAEDREAHRLALQSAQAAGKLVVVLCGPRDETGKTWEFNGHNFIKRKKAAGHRMAQV
jgi:hypothetical protein